MMEFLFLVLIIWILKWYFDNEDKKENEWRNENTTEDLLNELRQKKKKSYKHRTKFTTPKKPSLDYKDYWDDSEYRAAKREYMKSYKYQRKRKARLKMDNYECQQCGSQIHLNCHHKSYHRLGKEDIKEDLIIVCQECHNAIHQKYGYDYNGYFPLLKD